MAKYLCIKDSQVTNVIVADQEFISSPAAQELNYDLFINLQDVGLVDNQTPWIGWSYDQAHNQFTAPPQEEGEPE